MPTQQNIARDDTITAIRFPIRLLTVALVLTTMAFAGFGWIIFDARRDAEMFRDRLSRIEELRGVIVHLGEVLTMSARMAATTGDSRWEERFHHFEPQLDAAIKETIKIGASSSNIKAATKTDAANIKLVEMENRAFALVRAGRKEEAQTVLFSPEYETQKQSYAEGILSFVNQIRREFDKHVRDDQRLDVLSIIAALVVGGTSFVAWLSVARGVRRWRAQLLDSFHRRAEAEENLRKAHAELEVRVKERIADLAKANEALQAENSERMRAEEALRASHQIIEGIINAIPARVFWKDKNLVYLGCNAAFARDAGFADPKDIIGKDDYQMGWRDRAELYRGDDRQVIESGCSKLLIEEPLTTPEGNTLTILTSKIPLRSSEGEISGVLGTFMDITERKEAEAALSESKRFAERIAENSTSLIYLFDLETGTTAYTNRTFAEFLGYSPAQIIELGDKTLSTFIHPEDLARITQHYAHFAEVPDNRVVEHEYRVKHASGEWRWFWARDTVFNRRPNGAAWQILGTAQDMTERRRIEQELKEAKVAAAVREGAERYSFLADAVPQIIWTARPDGCVDYYNKAWFDYTGLTLAQTKDWGWEAVLHPADLQPCIERWTHSFTTGENYEIEYRFKRASDGAYRWHLGRALPMRDEQGQIVQWVGTCTDIDDAKRSKETLQA
ncbi:MAG TPA: PAS domain S-box protein, partial [Chthoniobacterales bacterium]